MKTHSPILSFFVAALALPLSALAADETVDTLRRLEGSAFDQAFLQHMTEHHRQGIQMSQLAAERAQRGELKQLAQKSAQDQQREIGEMQPLLTPQNPAHTSPQEPGSLPTAVATTERTAGDLPPQGANTQSPASTEQAKTMNQSLTKLQDASETDFDKVFIDEMTKHHRSGREMAELATRRAQNREVSSLAEKTAQHQQREIEELNRLRP